MRRANYWMAMGVVFGMASGSSATDPKCAKRDSSGRVVSSLPLVAGVDYIPPSSTPIIVNGYLVYETTRTKDSVVPKGPVRLWWDYVRSPQNQNEPDGFYTPLGASSFWTEWKYTFGSSKAFFGSADAAPTHRQFFNPELPPGYLLRAWHPIANGRVK